jgi:hypothetical protein
VHGTQDILLCWLAHGILLVVREDDHVLTLVAEVLHEVGCHVADVVDAASQLASLTKVVDTDQQALPPASAVGISEGIVLRGAVAEMLWAVGGRCGLSITITIRSGCCGWESR